MLLQPFKGFCLKAIRKSQIQPDCIFAAKGPAVLPDHTAPDTLCLKLFDRLFIFSAPIFAVQEEHVGPLRLRHLYAFEILMYKPAGIFHIFPQNIKKLFQPLLSFHRVRTDQGIHGKNIDRVIMRKGRLL